MLLLKKDTHQSGSSCIIQKESSSSHSYDGDRTSNVHSVHHSPQVQFHDWGGGNRLCGDNEQLNIPDNGRSRDVSQSALLRSVLGNSLDSSRSNIQGEASGDRLLSHTVTSTAADSSRSNDERDRKNAMMKAIEKRNAQHKTPDGLLFL